VHYSGTVAAALEGVILGIPGIAISALQRSVADEEANGRVARRVVEEVLKRGLPDRALLNVNIPNPDVAPIQGVLMTKLGSRAYENFIEPKPGGELKSHYTIGGEAPVWKEDDGTDIAAVRRGFVSVTPIQVDTTDYKVLVDMERWRFEL